MNRAMGILGAVAVGTGLMYLLDPNSGAHRRSLLRDRATSLAHDTEEFLGKATRDARNRGKGILARSRSRIERDEAPDEVIAERLRSRIGRFLSHPRAIEVNVREGEAVLRGPILTKEVRRLVQEAQKVPGVRRVVNLLEPHRGAEGVPALQGDARPRRARSELRQGNWSPTMGAVAGAAGAVLAIWALRRGEPIAASVAILGSGALVRSKMGAGRSARTEEALS
ncbi:MAG: BON domain-containing protein [Candidatus Eisenbacteria bacterium]